MYDYQSIKPMKTAIVGCGAISDVFFKNFTERFRIIDLVKCCSKGGLSAQRKAEQYGVEKSTFDEILADPEIELIVNLTPAAQHYDSRGVGAAEMAWALRLGRKPRVSSEFVLHCQEIIQGIEESFKTKRFYEMTTTCERPRPLPRGYQGKHAVFAYDEEGALIF